MNKALLKMEMVKNGVKQYDIARELGVNRNTITRWIQTGDWPCTQAAKVCEMLHIDDLEQMARIFLF